jgi:hypothetical protein
MIVLPSDARPLGGLAGVLARRVPRPDPRHETKFPVAAQSKTVERR